MTQTNLSGAIKGGDVLVVLANIEYFLTFQQASV